MTESQETRAVLPSLDIGGNYPWRLVTVDGETQLELDLSTATVSPGRKISHLVEHMQQLLRLDGADGKPQKPLENAQQAQQSKKLHFSLKGAGQALVLRINNEPISELQQADGQLKVGPRHVLYQLAVSETRSFGLELPNTGSADDEIRHLPYSRKAREGFDPKKHAPITDVHTHSTAQISARDLMQAALEQDQEAQRYLDALPGQADAQAKEKQILEDVAISYPVELLQKLGVYPDPEHPQTPTHMIGRKFNPMRKENLDCEKDGVACQGIRVSQLTPKQKEAVTARLQVPADVTLNFTDFDSMLYRYLNPLMKHPAMTKRVLYKIAEEYRAQGVRYAELSTGSMLDPQWFKQMAEVVADLDSRPASEGWPKLRFLIGIPRNISAVDTFPMLEKIKYLARHPYIVGADLLGYEDNKTKEFNWALGHLADWARASTGTELRPEDGWDFKRDFILRVHAGETDKNPENVRDAIRIAARYGVRLRVGHGLNAEMTKESMRDLAQICAHASEQGLANPDQFATERCMDSNQVYRNTLLVRFQPRFLKVRGADGYQHDVPRFLGTDGGGALGTDPRQLAYSALGAGMTLHELEDIHRFEEGYIDRQNQREQLKSKAFHKIYANGTPDFLAGYQRRCSELAPATKDPEWLPHEFDGKKPLLIGGASGTSWTKMSDAEKNTVIRSCELLVNSCDPKKVYFMVGRVQPEGVSKSLDIAVRKWNEAHPNNRFSVLGKLNGANEPSAEIAETVSWVQNILGDLSAVPGAFVEHLKRHQGHAVLFEGKNLTSAIAHGCRDEHIPYAVQQPMSSKNAVGGHRAMHAVSVTNRAPMFRTLEDFVDEVLKPVGEHLFFRSEEDKQATLTPGIDLDAQKLHYNTCKLDKEHGVMPTGHSKGSLSFS